MINSAKKRILRIFIALFCIYSPFFLFILVFINYFELRKGLEIFFLESSFWAQKLYRILNIFSVWTETDLGSAILILFKTAIHALNFSLESMALVACLSLAANLLFFRLNGLSENKIRLNILFTFIFSIFAFVVAFLFWPCPAGAFLFSITVTTAYILNYPLSEYIWKYKHLHYRSQLFAMPVLSFCGVSYILTPALLFGFLTWCLFPESMRARRYSVGAGRVLFNILTLLVAVSAFLSFRPHFISDNVYRLLSVKNLYGVFLDYDSNRLLITQKQTKYSRPQYSLPLDKIHSNPKLFYLKSREVEDLALDQENNLIYHVDRSKALPGMPLRLLSMDYQSLETISDKALNFVHNTGSIRLALAKKERNLFISLEIGLLLALDTFSGKMEKVAFFGSHPFILLDEENGLLYISLAWDPKLYALDIKSRQVVSTVKAPLVNQLPALSKIRKELYAPAPMNSEIWVYKTPGLELSRKIKSDFGVRTIAVDDKRGLLLACNYMTGYLKVMDIDTEEIISSHFIGFYSRAIVLDKPRRRAFITLADDGLFCLYY